MTSSTCSCVLLILFSGLVIPHDTCAQDELLVHYSALQCDSLVQANADNPNFVILDVRTPGEYNPSHLHGAINRNFFDPDFNDQLAALPRHKLYLMHCASGARSGPTFTQMVDLGFTRVVEMVGGISAWNSAGLPATADFSPLLMALSDTASCGDTVTVSLADTIALALTNRANDTLLFTSFTDLAGTEFSTDFGMDAQLYGADDYLFHIFYAPIDEGKDSIDFVVQSNGGEVVFSICGTGELEISMTSDASGSSVHIYPNPVRDILYVGWNSQGQTATYGVFDCYGKQVAAGHIRLPGKIDMNAFDTNPYLLVLTVGNRVLTGVILKLE
jgi:rhodanese-related sulfurtransferase